MIWLYHEHHHEAGHRNSCCLPLPIDLGLLILSIFQYYSEEKKNNRDDDNYKKSAQNTDGDNLNGVKEKGDDGKYYTGNCYMKGKRYRGK